MSPLAAAPPPYQEPRLVKHGHWFKQEWPQFKRNDVSEQEGHSQVPTMSDKWRLVDLFMEYKGLVTQHIDSYNHFVRVGLKDIMSASSNVEIRSDSDPKWFLKYEHITVGRPCKKEDMCMTETSPHMCRLRDFTYSAPIYVDIQYFKGDSVVRKRNVEIGLLPVMLRSCLCVLHGKTESEIEQLGECPYDPGGYFIVKGVERVLMMQEQPLTNRIIVELDPKKNLQAFVTSSTADNKSRTVLCEHPSTKKAGLHLKHSAFMELINVAIVMKAMGVQSDIEIIQMVGIEKMYLDALMPSLQEIHEKSLFSQKSALEYLVAKLKETKTSRRHGASTSDVLDVLRNQVLSHVQCPRGNLAPKIRYFGLMIRRLIAAQSDPTLIDDRDYYGNKRLELSGSLISVLFEDQFKNMNAELQKQADLHLSKWHQTGAGRRGDLSSYPDVLELWTDRSRLTKAMNNSISSGNWNIKRYRIERAGVSQVLSRFSYMSCVGSMMRVKSSFAGPRALQPSQWGMLCPADTPEGEQCGLVKHLSLLTHVTTGESEEALRSICFCLGVEDALALSGEEMHHVGVYLVILNGDLLGVHRRPKQFMSNLQLLRRRGRVGEFVSIYEHEGWHAIFIASDAGRLCRPLIIVQNGKPQFDPAKHVPLILKPRDAGGMSFEDFLKQGVLEWVDVNEENNLYIALEVKDITNETTHLEIEPYTILGVVSGLIPYPNHNQSPRNTYECAMGKQAMGCIAMNQFTRCDTLLLGLTYPQKPLCTSKTLNLVNFHHLGAGQNASVAVMSYSGYDIEDAIIMNRAALDRGFGRCHVMRRTIVPLSTYENGARDLLAPPPAADPNDKRGGARAQNVRYSALGEDGMVRPGEKVEDGYILAHKLSPVETKDIMRMDGSAQYKSTPVSYKNTVSSYIDRVILTSDAEGMTVYKIVTRQTRRPEPGDKFASRHGQKGVVGLIVPEEDMPFSESGWRPDLIMNPHGFPSRMTVGKMLELVGSKAAVLEGIFANGSAFINTPAQDIYRTLISHGFAPTGKEYLTSGITGEALESYVFCGPIYYQKLKHMVVDKMHARARGPRMVLTRQPTEGRAKEGGLRLGEMERDCLVAYGASNLLLERLMISSDACSPTVCRKCGLFCGRPDWCKFCNSGDFVAVVRMPYACKLLFQEMQSMNVCCRLNLVER
eukprot:CAMPEP_0176186648 /NCGR_PEP_ID=MMETSP0121_2-20121125/1979_1 /TAXON_ID=160619 /ORGANISM="Kryptoperidinium foliaceum, Strain CCMP 1326" /LENGTH=1173 /DNA_ID=CAMNT_0017525141 /DNA_START=50 /DNA_END=3571 /DNA_ORIENTATION=-